jgi:hypothetical protein
VTGAAEDLFDQCDRLMAAIRASDRHEFVAEYDRIWKHEEDVHRPLLRLLNLLSARLTIALEDSSRGITDRLPQTLTYRHESETPWPTFRAASTPTTLHDSQPS